MNDVMIDMETLGTVADSVILSIGAVRFDADGDKIHDNAFYASVSIDSNLAMKRRISEDTLIWWMKQEASAQMVFHEPKQPLQAALEALSTWFADTGHISGKDRESVKVWSNGADFDIPMLNHAYSQFSWDQPWMYWNQRCFRTLKGLPMVKNVRKPENKLKHNALADALNQAQHLQLINKVLRNCKVPTMKAAA